MSTNRNGIQGAAYHDERAGLREVVATKRRRRRFRDSAAKTIALTWGDLASCLKGRRDHASGAEREVSRGHSSGVEAGQGSPVTPEVFGVAKDRMERRAKRP